MLLAQMPSFLKLPAEMKTLIPQWNALLSKRSILSLRPGFKNISALLSTSDSIVTCAAQCEFLGRQRNPTDVKRHMSEKKSTQHFISASQRCLGVSELTLTATQKMWVFVGVPF